jgi:hypothetical protein
LKVSGFGNQEATIELFKTIKFDLFQYVLSLSQAMNKNSLKMIYAVLNTNNLMFDLLDSLVASVSTFVSSTKQIMIDDIKGQIGAEIKRQIFFLSDSFIKDIKIELALFSGGQFFLLTEWLSVDNLNCFYVLITEKIVNVYLEKLFSTKNVKIEFSSELSLTVHEMKNILVMI